MYVQEGTDKTGFGKLSKPVFIFPSNALSTFVKMPGVGQKAIGKMSGTFTIPQLGKLMSFLILLTNSKTKAIIVPNHRTSVGGINPPFQKDDNDC